MSIVKPIQEIRKIGYQAFVQALGPVDATRYMRSCEGGFGNYTAERKNVLNNDVHKVVSGIQSCVDSFHYGREVVQVYPIS